VIKIEFRFCKLCGSTNAIENHHITFRSQCKPLENCEMNQVDLCHSCHDFLHHNGKGYELDHALKMEFQANIEMLFLGQTFTLEEIQEALGISYNAVYRLSKNMKLEKGKYTRDSIVLACLGGEYPQERYERIKAKEGERFGT
jgi:transposase-like protein